METKTEIKIEKKTESEMTGVELMQEMVNLDESDEDEVFMKSHLLSRVNWSFPLYFYDKGTVMFFDEKDKLFGDKVLISMFSEGTSKVHSEKLALEMEKEYMSDEYILLPRTSIKHFEISQNICPNPDCESCVADGKPIATLSIFTESKPISIYFFTQAEALHFMIMFNSFKEGKITEFLNNPFEDDYSQRYEKKKVKKSKSNL